MAARQRRLIRQPERCADHSDWSQFVVHNPSTGLANAAMITTSHGGALPK